MSTPTTYIGSSLPVPTLVVGGLALVLLLVLGCCSLVNLTARRPVLNGWLWGGAVVVFLVAYHLLAVRARGPVSGTQVPADGGEVVGTTIGLAVLLGVAAWRAVAWRRRTRPA